MALGLKKETADCYYWQECDQYGDPNGKWHLDILNDDTREHFEYLVDLFGICLHLEDALFIPAWSLHRLMFLAEIKGLAFSDLNSVYETTISIIAAKIRFGYFNKEYLV